MKAALHKLMSPLLYKSGIYSGQWKKQAQSEPFSIVLTYHRVVPDNDQNINGFDIERGVPVSVFEAQIRFMLKHFKPVKASRIKEFDKDNICFAVTLDDGYKDNYEVAAPVLEKLGVPATFFVVSDYVGTDRLFWWEQVARMVHKTRIPELRLQRELEKLTQFGLAPSVPLSSEVERDDAYTKLCAALRAGPHRSLPKYIDNLSASLDVPLPQTGRSYHLMDWVELKDLLHRGFEVGGHTATHINVVGADSDMLEKEILLSTRQLEDKLNTAVKAFAYPYGNFDETDSIAKDYLRSAGYEIAFTTVKSVVSDSSDPYQIPRTQLNRQYDFACAYNIQNALNNSQAFTLNKTI